ncbi:MAG: S8 family serine peptidase [Pseudomonadota bacterium]
MNCVKSRLATRPTLLNLSIGVVALACMDSAMAARNSRVIVSYQEGGAEQVKAAVHAARGTVRHQVFGANAMAVEMSTAGIARMARHGAVKYIEPDLRRYPMALASASAAPYQSGQLTPYGIGMVQADKLPDTPTANRKICIIDSGFDRKHEDLLANQVTGDSDSGSGNWYQDQGGHGTHVAGTIAAVNNNGRGVVGVLANRQVKLHIVKIFGVDNKYTYSSTVASAANQCAKAGAHVVNMSLGGSAFSRTEADAFDALQRRGILLVAASGNDGNGLINYPAGYASVMMVGAVDSNRNWASFSQYNSKVELSAPGAGVLSTVPTDSGTTATLKVGANNYTVGILVGSPRASVTAPLADFGLGNEVNPAMAGKVCLIKRGDNTFADKVSKCESSGGVGAVVFNNAPETFAGTLNGTVTALPALSVAGADGAALLAQLGQPASAAVTPTSYDYKDGTSMATPHVAAVAALVWSYYPSCSAKQIRTTLIKSALDLGPLGRDNKFGYGLVQARAAYDRIAVRGCGN